MCIHEQIVDFKHGHKVPGILPRLNVICAFQSLLRFISLPLRPQHLSPFVVGARGQWRGSSASHLVHVHRLFDELLCFRVVAKLGVDLRARNASFRLKRRWCTVRSLLVKIVSLLAHWQCLPVPSEAVSHQTEAEQHSTTIPSIRTMLLFNELQRLAEVVFSFLVVPEGVIGVGYVFTQRRALAQNVLHLMKKRQGLPESRLFPPHERQSLDSFQLVLVSAIATHRVHLV
mmetsp:Transcript_2660/g.7954  ORF Transcript_2660/g.7954 Transcript_2660/m.7954 type:complete len:230 (+) Transcript_2660:1663-2352(+)